MTEEQIIIDKMMVMGFGSIISITLVIIGYFLKQAHQDTRKMLDKINTHESRINVHESKINRHESDIDRLRNNDPYSEIQNTLAQIMVKLKI